MKIPVVDLGRCAKCESCLSVCPQVFRMNEAFQTIDVVDLDSYPEECVDEAIKICPVSCIAWEERVALGRK